MTQETSTVARLSLLDELEQAVVDRTAFGRVDGILRGLTPSILSVLSSKTTESFAELMDGLTYACGQVGHEAGDGPFYNDPKYILGRMEGLLHLLAVVEDRTVSTEVVEYVRARPALLSMLKGLVASGEISISLDEAVKQCEAADADFQAIEAMDLICYAGPSKNGNIGLQAGMKTELVIELCESAAANQ